MTKSSTLLLTVLLVGMTACIEKPVIETTLIQNVKLVDGSGKPAFISSLRINGDKIEAIGNLEVNNGENIINGEGLVLVPGFIDTHSHHDWDTLSTVAAAISQGITTIVVGQDGSSHYPLKTYFDSLARFPLALNLATYAGHNTLRRRVMGDDFRREATSEEIDSMRSLLKQELASGALGLSTGLEYDPGIYSSTEEVLALAKVVKLANGRYISHLRSEDRNLENAIEEIILIGREAEIPVQISHMKLARKSLWGKADKIIKMLDSARSEGIDITADVYPYEYWQSTMTVLFPNRDFDNREAAEYALTELTTPEGMILTRFEAEPNYIGKSIAEIAVIRNQDPVSTYMELIAMSQQPTRKGESVVASSMSEEDIMKLFSWSYTNVCSDGASASGHPRGWGAFPRFYHQTTKENKIFTLEESIQKMTGQAALNLGLSNMGIIKVGANADLILINEDKLRDQATIKEPNKPSSGIIEVWVNGVSVYKNGKVTGKLPGWVILRQNH